MKVLYAWSLLVYLFIVVEARARDSAGDSESSNYVYPWDPSYNSQQRQLYAAENTALDLLNDALQAKRESVKLRTSSSLPDKQAVKEAIATSRTAQHKVIPLHAHVKVSETYVLRCVG